MRCIFKWLCFHRHVSYRGCNIYNWIFACIYIYRYVCVYDISTNVGQTTTKDLEKYVAYSWDLEPGCPQFSFPKMQYGMMAPRCKLQTTPPKDADGIFFPAYSPGWQSYRFGPKPLKTNPWKPIFKSSLVPSVALFPNMYRGHVWKNEWFCKDIFAFLAPFAPLAGIKTKSSFPKHSKSLQNKAPVDERNPAPVLGLLHHHLIALTKLMIIIVIIINDQINDESHCIYQLGPPNCLSVASMYSYVGTCSITLQI